MQAVKLTYDRLKPSGETSTLEMTRSATGPMAANAGVKDNARVKRVGNDISNKEEERQKGDPHKGLERTLECMENKTRHLC